MNKNPYYTACLRCYSRFVRPFLQENTKILSKNYEILTCFHQVNYFLQSQSDFEQIYGFYIFDEIERL